MGRRDKITKLESPPPKTEWLEWAESKLDNHRYEWGNYVVSNTGNIYTTPQPAPHTHDISRPRNEALEQAVKKLAEELAGIGDQGRMSMVQVLLGNGHDQAAMSMGQILKAAGYGMMGGALEAHVTGLKRAQAIEEKAKSQGKSLEEMLAEEDSD